MKNSERLQHEIDLTLAVEGFLHDLSGVELPVEKKIKRQKLESKVKLLRARYHLHMNRLPLSSLRLGFDSFPKDLEAKRPRSLTSPDLLTSCLPDVPEEDELGSPKSTMKSGKFDLNSPNNHRPRSSTFPLTL
ncbi:uncharacterized protein LOC124447975 isoform X2 [Xenia sp. Carnegie-2017]|uniref:uncharacterized protein LOC124447975 isoform X2 n=1 Tax=Xenia sp. Carnegie-2017 TaxID=2897299 RepID=UPI001F036333|nr:uncharacterized protein LOC124447975 isoform X2 [Xenia sp. Carnegie-2017]